MWRVQPEIIEGVHERHAVAEVNTIDHEHGQIELVQRVRDPPTTSSVLKRCRVGIIWNEDYSRRQILSCLPRKLGSFCPLVKGY